MPKIPKKRVAKKPPPKRASKKKSAKHKPSKPVVKPEVHRVYVEAERRWMTIPDAVRRLRAKGIGPAMLADRIVYVDPKTTYRD